MTKQIISDAETLKNVFEAKGLSSDDIMRDDVVPLYKMVRKSLEILLEPYPRAEIESNHSIDGNAPLVAVIVETRAHYNLAHIVNQIHTQIQVPIQIFHSPENYEFIMKSSLRNLIEAGDVVLSQIKTVPMTAKTYNMLFLTTAFWKSVIGRQKILIFQTDVALSSRSKHKIKDFLTFDYIGSTWKRENWTGLWVDGGNGGLSLRDWSKSVEAIERFPIDDMSWAEDIFFAFHIELIGGKVGKSGDCARFSMQDEYIEHSFGAHKLQFMSPVGRLRLLFANPDAWRILPRVAEIRLGISKFLAGKS